MNIARRTGFTLIEMMIVVAIIAILFTILLAQLGNAKRRSTVVSLEEGLSTFRVIAQTQARTDPDGYTNVCVDGTTAGAALLRAVERAKPAVTDIASSGIRCVTAHDSFAVDANQLLSDIGLTETYCVDLQYAGAGTAVTTQTDVGPYQTCQQ